jgi:Ice-binding-like
MLRTRLRTTRLLVAVSLAALLAAACSVSPTGVSGDLSANARWSSSYGGGSTGVVSSLGNAAGYVILGGGPTAPSVTLTTSAITGNVGSGIVGGGATLTSSTVAGNVNADVIVNTTSTVTGTGPSDTAAFASFLAAYTAVAATPIPVLSHRLSGTLSGVTLTPGVYSFNGAATLTGTLTLDAQGNPNATWTFLIGTWPHDATSTGALTATDFSVVMANGANPSNVTWWVAQAVTMTRADISGTILAGAAITFTGTAGAPGDFNFYGHAFAKDAVTVTDYTFNVSTATTVGGGGNGNPGKDCDRDRDNDRHQFNKHHNWCQDHDWNKQHDGDRDNAPDKDRYDNDHCQSGQRGW